MNVQFKSLAVLLALCLLGLHATRSVALDINDGEVVVIDYQVDDDVMVYAGGSLSVQDGAVINGEVIVEGALVVSGGSLSGGVNDVFLKGSSTSRIDGGVIDSPGFRVQEDAVLEVNGGDWSMGSLWVQDDARADFKDGTYDLVSSYFQDDAVVTVSGGDWSVFGLYLQGRAQTTLEGGVFVGQSVYFQGHSSSVVSGGEFILGGSFFFQGSSNQEITGGLFSSNDSSAAAFVFRQESTTLIKGGTFLAAIDVFVVSQNGVVEITGGNLSSIVNVGGTGGVVRLFGHSRFNYPFGTYGAGSELDGAAVTGQLFSGEEISVPGVSINDGGSVVLARLTNPALVMPVSTMALWQLGVLAFLLGMLAWFRDRKFG